MTFKARAPPDQFIRHFTAAGKAGKALQVIFSPLMVTTLLPRHLLCHLMLRNGRPATGTQNPETRNSSKKTQKLPPGPRPAGLLEKNSKNTKNIQKILKLGISSIFLVFFKEFRVGARGVIFEFFFEEFRDSGFWVPVSIAGRPFLKSCVISKVIT